MKQLVKFVSVVCAMLFSIFSSYGQDDYSTTQRTIKSIPIVVCTDKTTNLIFNYSIKSVDRGSSSILVQRAIGADNILQIKADVPNFKQTNLSVVTSDGAFYSFLVDYNANPAGLNIVVPTNYIGPLKELGYVSKEALIQRNAKAIASIHKPGTIAKIKSDEIIISVQAIFIQSETSYFRLQVENNSNIDFDIESLALSLSDRVRGRRTAMQEQTFKPVYVFGNAQQVRAGSSQIVVLAMPKIIVPGDKFLSLQINEKNGGRHIELAFKKRQLARLQRL